MTTQQTVKFKLIAIGKVRATIAQAVKMKQDATISAAFYGLVVGDVSWSTNMIKTDVADFDNTLRTLLPIKWKEAGYAYDAKKANEIAKKLGLNLDELRKTYRDNKEARESIVTAFYVTCMNYYNNRAEEDKQTQLDAAAIMAKLVMSAKSAITNAKKGGVSLHEMISTMQSAGYEIPSQWLEQLVLSAQASEAQQTETEKAA